MDGPHSIPSCNTIDELAFGKQLDLPIVDQIIGPSSRSFANQFAVPSRVDFSVSWFGVWPCDVA